MLALLFLVGFTSLVYEIYSLTVVFMFIVESSQAGAIAISAFLAGLAFSSWLTANLIRRKKLDSYLLLAGMQLLAGTYAGLILSHHEWIPRILDTVSAEAGSPLHGAVLWIYLFIPAVFIGSIQVRV